MHFILINSLIWIKIPYRPLYCGAWFNSPKLISHHNSFRLNDYLASSSPIKILLMLILVTPTAASYHPMIVISILTVC